MSKETQNMLRHWREAVPNDRMAHLVRDASRAFRKALQIRLQRHGIPFSQWVFLRVLWESDGLTQKELSDRAGVMEPTTFAAMRGLEEQGYITRKKSATNKKNMYIYLTDAGQDLKNKLVPLAEEVNRISVVGISPRSLGAARQVLLAIMENLGNDELTQSAPNDPD